MIFLDVDMISLDIILLCGKAKVNVWCLVPRFNFAGGAMG